MSGESTPESRRAAMRRILNPNKPELFKKEDLIWKTATKDQEVTLYRGQCANVTSKRAATAAKQGFFSPYVIRTDVGSVLSTSKTLSDTIEKFAKCPPLEEDTPERRSGGRIFEIRLLPGVRYADLEDSLGYIPSKELEAFAIEFQTNQDEAVKAGALDAKGLRQWTVERIKGILFPTAKKEKEVLLDLSEIEFVHEDGSPETWGSGPRDAPPQLATMEFTLKRHADRDPLVTAYRTYVAPKQKGGRRRRGRTFRSKTLRRNKHGGRFTRQSKRRIRDSHA
jgi:hypothetical protein